jgi:hypothetical protein
VTPTCPTPHLHPYDTRDEAADALTYKCGCGKWHGTGPTLDATAQAKADGIRAHFARLYRHPRRRP